MEQLKIRNWDKWQSYRKDRHQPPWIKLHRCVMRDPDWVAMSDAQRGQLVAMWLLAADRGGVIPASASVIKKLCYLDDEPDLKYFIDNEFLVDDANVASTWRQSDAPEKRRVEKRREENKLPCVKSDDSTRHVDSHSHLQNFDQFWQVWPIKRQKKTAKEIWRRKQLDESIDELIADVKSRLAHDRRWRDGFIPNVTTYLNQHRWEDEYEN